VAPAAWCPSRCPIAAQATTAAITPPSARPRRSRSCPQPVTPPAGSARFTEVSRTAAPKPLPLPPATGRWAERRSPGRRGFRSVGRVYSEAAQLACSFGPAGCPQRASVRRVPASADRLVTHSAEKRLAQHRTGQARRHRATGRESRYRSDSDGQGITRAEPPLRSAAQPSAGRHKCGPRLGILRACERLAGRIAD